MRSKGNNDSMPTEGGGAEIAQEARLLRCIAVLSLRRLHLRLVLLIWGMQEA